jgi:hypothetical protein
MTFRPFRSADLHIDLTNKRFLGLVIDNKDPKNLRRVKIRIRGLHTDVEDADIPWVKCDIGFGVHGNMPGVGSISLPAIGSKVWVQSQDSHGMSMHVIGAAAQDDDKTSELVSDDYDAYGFIDVAGNKLFVSPKNETFEFTFAIGTTIKVDANGAVTIISAQNVSIEANGSLNLKGQTVNIDGVSGVNIKGNPVHLNESGSPSSPTPVTARTKPKARDVANKKDF